MTIEFKPGDRVKCVGTNDNSKPEGDGRGLVGAVYTVKSCGECSVSLRLAEIPGTVGQNRFTLHAKAGEFAVGDKVVCDAAYGEYEPFAKGTVYEIKEFRIDRDGDKYVTPDDYGTGWDSARFRLATPEEIAPPSAPLTSPPEGGFLPGDLVECIGADGNRLTVGKRYVLAADDGNAFSAGDPIFIDDSGEKRSPRQVATALTARLRLISRPDAEGWHAWSGGECPLPDGTSFEVKNWCGDVVKDRPARVVSPSEPTAWRGTGGVTAFRIVPPTPAAEPAPAYKRGDTVMARVKLQDDIDEDGEFYAGYLRAEDIVSLERAAKPLAVGARVSFDSYGEKLTGTLSIIIRSAAIIDTGDDVYFKDVSEVEAAQ